MVPIQKIVSGDFNMENRTFGKTGLPVSVLGFGGAPIGFLETEQNEVAAILNFLLDQGVNLIDTAAMYQGSEEAIGKAISHRRKEYIMVSKCPNSLTEPWTADAITRSIDRSLQRLNTDHVDIMLLHSCDLLTLKQGEALQALIQARDAGKIRFAAYSGDNEAASHACLMPDIAVIETSVNICDQANIDKVLPAAQKHSVGVIVKRPIANAAWKKLSDQPGMYSGYAKTYTERLAAMNITPADLGFAGDLNQAWPEIAIRFTLSQPGVHTAIIGSTNRQHVQANIDAVARGPLPPDVIDKLRSAFQKAQTAAGTRWTGQT
jgi:aryl-alcohol dehydrogenase-like predicted oxidoreductase